MTIIAYQGLEGAFSCIAARQLFGNQQNYVSYETVQKLGEAVQKGQVDYAILPIENSLAGSVYTNYDCLTQYDLKITAEVYLKIELCLLVINDSKEELDVKLKTLKQVLSHPKALEQCKRFFEKYPWVEPVTVQNTAIAAARVSQMKDSSIGAIASLEAADLYQLKVLQKNLEDNAHNYTRFICITSKLLQTGEFNKCSLMLQLLHQPKTLHKVLKFLAQANYNLTKIESRPIEGYPFEYIFYVDFEFNFKQKKNLQVVLKRIQEITQKFKLLGLYQAGHHG